MASKCDKCGQANVLGEPLTLMMLSLDDEGYPLRLCSTCEAGTRAAVMTLAWYSQRFEDPVRFQAPTLPTPTPVATAVRTPTIDRDYKVPFPAIQRGTIAVIDSDPEAEAKAAAVTALDGIAPSLAKELVDTYRITDGARAGLLGTNVLPLHVMRAAHCGMVLRTQDDGVQVREYDGIRVKVDPRTNVIVHAYIIR